MISAEQCTRRQSCSHARIFCYRDVVYDITHRGRDVINRHVLQLSSNVLEVVQNKLLCTCKIANVRYECNCIHVCWPLINVFIYNFYVLLWFDLPWNYACLLIHYGLINVFVKSFYHYLFIETAILLAIIKNRHGPL